MTPHSIIKTDYMLQKFCLLGFLSIFYISVFAQKNEISGIIKDTATKVSVKNAVVMLLTAKDSVLTTFTRVKEDGSYILKNIMPGKYIFSVTHPNFGDFVDDIDVKNSNEILAPVSMTPKSKLLEAVIVKSGNPIRLKGDTTIYTADSFKVSANANVEELLKKMPGIQVDKNGQIKAMGQTVEKVLVDGEEFFGDDPGMAVKNLRADAVKEVQVFDKKSEQSAFTGIDDGKTQKTINLKLKEDKKKGYFGKVDVAGGTQKNIDDRYNNNILLSSFKGKRKITGFLLNGNTGQDGLNWQDEQKFGGGNDNMTFDEESGNTYYSNGGSDGEPYINTQNGFITNLNAGAQYSNKFHDKATLNLSPKYNSQRYNNGKQVYSQTQFKDSLLIKNATGYSNVNRNNIKLRGSYDIKLDSTNSLKITANANFYNTKSIETENAITTGEKGNLKNATDRFTNNNIDKDVLSGNAIFKHKFKKNRRTFSVNADWSLINIKGKNFLKSYNEDFFNNFLQNIDQMKDNDRSTSTASTKIVYTEPLSKNYSLELGYQIGINNGTNNQTTFNYTSLSAKYDTKIDSLSNHFKQNITQNIPSAKINYAYKKIKINIGSGISFVNFNLKDLDFNKIYNRNYTNFFPSANLNYTYKSNHSLRVIYNGSTRQPTLDQLQPLRNNNDQFNQTIGNPDLRNSFTNNFSLSHNAYNFIKDFYIYQSLNVAIESNAITYDRTIETNTGKTTSKPINTNGNFSSYLYGGAGFKIKKIDTRINLNQNLSYRRSADFLNRVRNLSNIVSSGTSLYISKSKDKKYDISLSNRLEYNFQRTSQTNISNSFRTYTLGFEGTVYYKKVWSVTSEYNLNARQKTAQVSSISNNMWNAKLQRTFKKDEFTVYGSVKDILNQNIGVDRSYYGTTFTETRNDRLQRYFLIGFTWNFKNQATKAK